jgi:catalase
MRASLPPNVSSTALIVSANGIAGLLKEATARDFVADAFTHCKFIGYVAEALPLLEKAGIAGDLDEGTIELKDKKTVETFFQKVGKLRIWAREPSVKLN